MAGEMMVALALVVPVVLFPAALVWYLNFGGLYAAVKEAMGKRTAHEKA